MVETPIHAKQQCTSYHHGSLTSNGASSLIVVPIGIWACSSCAMMPSSAFPPPLPELGEFVSAKGPALVDATRPFGLLSFVGQI